MNEKKSKWNRSFIENPLSHEEINGIINDFKEIKKIFQKNVRNKKVTFILPNGNLTNNSDNYKYFEVKCERN
jgi:hypothetical protein